MSGYKPCKSSDCHNLIDRDEMRHYCSDACRQREYRKRHSQNSKSEKPALAKYCRNCGKRFATFNDKQIFHSVSCRVSFYQQQKRFALKDEGVLPNV